MERLKMRAIIFIVILVSVLSMVFYLYNNGIARDNGVYLNSFFTLINIIVLPLIVITYRKYKTGSSINDFKVPLIALFIITLINMYSLNTMHNQLNDTRIETIDSQKVISLNSDKKKAIIYFYRDDCEECVQLDGPLRKYLLDNSIYNVMGYDTNSDKSRKEEILDLYEVDQVPMIVEIGGGEIIRKIYYDELLSSINDNTLRLQIISQ